MLVSSWSRLGPKLESTRQHLEMTRALRGRLVLRVPEIYLSVFLPRVDSSFLGVDSAVLRGDSRSSEDVSFLETEKPILCLLN